MVSLGVSLSLQCKKKDRLCIKSTKNYQKKKSHLRSIQFDTKDNDLLFYLQTSILEPCTNIHCIEIKVSHVFKNTCLLVPQSQWKIPMHYIILKTQNFHLKQFYQKIFLFSFHFIANLIVNNIKFYFNWVDLFVSFELV